MKASSPRAPRMKPKLGQHFLVDKSAVVRIVEALGDISQATVLEIGPGRGALTSLLARTARRVIAIEKDRVLAAQLRMGFSLKANIEIIEGDFLAVDFDTLFGPKPGSTRPGIEPRYERVHVIGNLPYFITSDILLRLFRYRKHLETMVLMVQKEVADRLTARPGSKDYALLSATAQLYANVEKVFTLPPSAFSPPPKVFSSLVRLTPSDRLQKLRVDEDELIQFLKLSFGQKRKTLWNNLKGQYAADDLRQAMSRAQLRPQIRAEALTLEASASLMRELQGLRTPASPEG